MAICQYIAILWVQYIDMPKYNIVTALVQLHIKVGISCIAISKPWIRIYGQLQRLHNFKQMFWLNSFCLKMNSILRSP